MSPFNRHITSSTSGKHSNLLFTRLLIFILQNQVRLFVPKRFFKAADFGFKILASPQANSLTQPQKRLKIRSKLGRFLLIDVVPVFKSRHNSTLGIIRRRRSYKLKPSIKANFCTNVLNEGKYQNQSARLLTFCFLNKSECVKYKNITKKTSGK